MKHIRSFAIHPNHTEQVKILIQAGQIVRPLVRIYLGYNQVLSMGRVKHIRLHFPDGAYPNAPMSYTYNGIQYALLNAALISLFTITLGKRDGTYFCQDMPMANFVQIFTGHHIKTLDLDLDYTKSYIRNIDPASGIDGPFAFLFYFDMWGQIDETNR
jgi:hypothetical protein